MAKQNLRQKLIREGLRTLEQEGFAVTTPEAAMIALLQERFGKERSTDLAVVHLLGRIADIASVAALEGLAARAGDKEVKREIRRSLFNLAQRGFTTRKSDVEPREPSRPNFSLAPEIECYLLPIYGGGAYLMVFARPQTGGGLLVIQAVVNDRQGLRRVGGNVIRRKELREMMAEMKAQQGLSMVPVPWEYGDWRLHAAYEQARSAGVEGIEDYPLFRSRLTAQEPKEQPHPVLSHLDREETVKCGALNESGKILQEPEFKLWLIDEDLLAPYVDRVRSMQDSRIVLNPAQKEERLQSLVKEAVASIFLDDTMRPIFERRFQDVALHLVLSERKEKARVVLAVALALGRKDLGGMLGIPLLEDLVRRSLGLYMEREKEKPQEPSLIIKP